MKEFIASLVKSGELVEVYTHADKNDEFDVGVFFHVGDDFYCLATLDKAGRANGMTIALLEDIATIVTSSLYLKGIARMCTTQIYNLLERDLVSFEDSLALAQTEKLVVTLTHGVRSAFHCIVESTNSEITVVRGFESLHLTTREVLPTDEIRCVEVYGSIHLALARTISDLNE